MSIIVGLTGGIGSGKSTIAKWFEEKGTPVYNSDFEAKKLMNSNPELMNQLIGLFGDEVFANGTLNRLFISQKVFNDKLLLTKLNKIVHPAVGKDFRKWVTEQEKEMLVKEAAILFESGAYKDCDLIVSVVADEKTRIRRVMERDGVNEEQVRKRMNNQWTDEQRVEHSDFVIDNNSDLKALHRQFDVLYKALLKASKV